MHHFSPKSVLIGTAVTIAATISAQQPVTVGNGSYAAYPPAYKSKTEEHGGYQSTKIESKKLYIDETQKLPDGNRRPIPTNDWWTNLLNSQFADALWSYPQMLHPHESGVTVNYPAVWSDNGTEVLPTSSITVGGAKFRATSAIAKDWHDWDVEMLLPGTDSKQKMLVTMAHGMPFSWIETTGIDPVITFSAAPTFYDETGVEVTADDLSEYKSNIIAFTVGNDSYGLFLPKGALLKWSNNQLSIKYTDTDAEFLSIALLPEIADLSTFSTYAFSIPRRTTVSWSYNEAKSVLSTVWTVDAENLLDSSLPAPVIQGFLPHAYKNTVRSFDFTDYRYLTPRGTMKIACSDNNTFEYSYKFSGILPYYPAPHENNASANPFSPEKMTALINQYASEGTFGADTYWGGKGLTQMALNMTFAYETGNDELFAISRDKLKSALVDWLTYTPGEDNFFFAYYPRWGGLVGFDVTYDTDAFNDHHFHYGYFTYAGALLCLFDDEFKAEYGEMLKTLALDYANWNRNDPRFPFLRTLDIWAGHSYAGGLGDGANSNGNGQESSSEAMQSWGGLYLLGVALGDKEMRDAGIFGWCTESNGVAEYWFDRDQIHPDKEHNIDHTKYRSPYCTNLTSKGIGWWTWFSGDPLWMHSIQWMPVSPCLNYLSQDLDFVKWDYEKMISSTNYKWFEKVGENNPLADQSVGNVVLCYLERYNPDYAAEIFDKAWNGNYPMAKGTDTGHISYYVIQSHRTYGDIDFSITADCPTANAYRKANGTYTYVVFNPDNAQRTVRFFSNGAVVATVNVPAHKMIAYSDAATETAIDIKSDKGFIIPPSASAQLAATVLDQYGATIEGGKISFSSSNESLATISTDGILSIKSSAAKGSKFFVTATSDKGTTGKSEFTINDFPEIAEIKITPAPQYLEIGGSFNFSLFASDQYGNVFNGQTSWSITKDGKEVCNKSTFTPKEIGTYTVNAAIGDKHCTHKVLVTPLLPDISRNKKAVSSSEENAGTLTTSINDGNIGTRWGSAHTDNEWVYLDLGNDCYITRLEIDWEASFANGYDIQVAPDGAATTEYNGNYASGNKTVTIVAEDQWTTIKEIRNFTTGGHSSININAVGRYIRMKGVKRNSIYGYSIYEMAAHGIPAGTATNDIIGIDIITPPEIEEGKTVTLAAQAFTLAGDITSQAVTWSCNNDKCTFSGADFTAGTYGKIEITATTPENFTSSKTVLVNESVKLHSIEVSPTNSALILGDELKISLTGYNQFGGNYTIDNSSVKAIITEISDPDNPAPVDFSTASFDIETGIFRASAAGNYCITFTGAFGKAEARIIVSDVAETNLALNRPATASSQQGGNTAACINDGNPTSRWESLFYDNQRVTIDLESPFLVNKIKLLWEAAYANSYTIQASTDAENWVDIHHQSKCAGGEETIEFAPIPAQYIRIMCLDRATTFGFSIYEMEIFGVSRYEKEKDGNAPKITSFNITDENEKTEINIAATDESGYVFYAVDCYTTGAVTNCVATFTGYAESGKPAAIAIDGLNGNCEYEFRLRVYDAFGNEAFSTVKSKITSTITGKNLALGKETLTTSNENDGLSGKYAVDGNINTRWGSMFNDNESITVDLAAAFLIDNIVIEWNSPAFATDYTVEASLDNNTYTTIYTATGFAGGRDNITLAPTAARYIKVTGNKRATGYGTSINELEIYGTRQLISIVSDANGDKRLEGTWNDEVFTILDDEDATSYDMTAVGSVPQSFSTKNPNCLIYVSRDYQYPLNANVVRCNDDMFNAASIDIQEGYNFSAIRDIRVEGEMTFHASLTDEYECLTLPFPVKDDNKFELSRFAGIIDGNAIFSPITAMDAKANRPLLLSLSGPVSIIKGAGNTLYRTKPEKENGAVGVFKYTHSDGRKYRKSNSSFILSSIGETINPFEVVLAPADCSKTGYEIVIKDIAAVGSIVADKGASALVDVYNLRGIRLRHNVQAGKALDGLNPGIYIVGNSLFCK